MHRSVALTLPGALRLCQLVAAFVLFLGAAPASAQEPLFTFVQFSDCQPQTELEYANFDQVVAELAVSGQPGSLLPRRPSFVLIPGDLVWGNSPAEWELAMERLDQLTELGFPYRCVPGNHDVNNSDTTLYDVYIGDSGVWDTSSALVTGHNGLAVATHWGGLRFIGFNNSNPGWNTIEAGDLNEIQTRVQDAANAGENVLLVAHHPHDDKDRIPLTHILPEPSVVAYLRGHTETPFAAPGLALIDNPNVWDINSNAVYRDGALIYYEAFQTELHVFVLELEENPTVLPPPAVLHLVYPLTPLFEPDLGIEGPNHAGAGTRPTAAAPENKLWFHDGSWWGVLWSESSAAHRIARLEQATQTWIDVGPAVSTVPERRFDALLTGSTLILASHVPAVPAEPGNGEAGMVQRFTYDAGLDAWIPNGVPVAVNDARSETLSIERDSTGTLWAAWTQDAAVHLNHTSGGDDAAWGVPFALPLVEASALDPEDTAGLVAWNGRIGVLWSNGPWGLASFAVHVDGDAPGAWAVEHALADPAAVGDEIDLALSGGNVYAVVQAEDGRLTLLERTSGALWSTHAVAAAADGLRDPIALVDATNGLLRVFATGPTLDGESVAGGGAIWEKHASLSTLVFPPGRGTTVIQDGERPAASHASSTRSSVSAAGGLVVLSGNATTLVHRHAFDALAGPLPPPAASFQAAPSTGVAPLSVRFADLSSNQPSWWAWNFGDGGTSGEERPVHVFQDPGVYSVSLQVANGGGTDVKTITNMIVVAAPPPTQTFPVAADARVFEGNPDNNYGSDDVLRVRDISKNSHWSYLRFDVPSLDGGAYSSRLRLFCTDSSPAGGSLYQVADDWTESGITWDNRPPLPANPITVRAGVTAGFWFDFDLGATVSGPGVYSFALAGGSSNSAYYSSREGPGTPQLVVQLFSGDPPVADFAAGSLAGPSGPAPLTVSFVDLTSGGPTRWNWDFGDGATSTARNPVHVYTAPGSYMVLLDVTSPGGFDSLTRLDYVHVFGTPVADFSASPLTGQAPLAVTFSDLSIDATSWSWNFGDGSTSTEQDPVHVYAAPGSYTVTLDVSGPGGSDQLVRLDYVGVSASAPVAGFSASPLSGPAPHAVTFNDLSSNATSWAWNFGDGATSTAQHPVHVYATPGSYTVTLDVSGPGGSDQLVRLDYVAVSHPAPVAGFSASPLSGTAPHAVTFSDLSTNATSWSWNFGDGATSTAQHPVHVYAAPGSYTVTLDVSGPGGSDQLVRPGYVAVSSLAPVAGFSASPLSGTAPHAVTFSDLSSNATSWAWSFGDGATSTAQHPVHVYATPGSYTVTLDVSGPGGSDQLVRPGYVAVSPPAPVADFSASPLLGKAPLAVTFSDLSTNATSWAWDFGDGGTSGASNPQHVYTTPGVYTVTLVASNVSGSSTTTKTNLVKVSKALRAVADARVSEATPGGNYGTSTELRVRSAAGGSMHTYLRFDLSGLSGTVTSAMLRLFCTDESPVGGMVFPTTNGWSETGINWTNRPAATGAQIASLGAVATNTWVEVDVTSAVASGGLVSFLVTGTSSNSAIYASRETATQPELVIETGTLAAPVAEFSASPLSGTTPLAVTFSDLSTGVVTGWSWNFGDGASSSASNPQHVYTTPGLFTVTLVASNAAGSSQVIKTGLVSVSAPPPIQTLLALADARVSEATPGGNYGTSTELRVRSTTGGSFHTYLRFDLAGVGTVTSAKLRLYCTDESPVGGLVFPTSSGWSETGIKWNNRPAATGAQIASLGAVATNTWVEVDVTPAALGGGLVCFLLTSTSSNSASYASRETATQPQLVVETGTLAAPVAEFSASPLSGTTPFAVTFSDLSTGVVTGWSWNFGDGASSSASNPQHVYTTPGLFTVTLVASNAAGSSQVIKTNLVNVSAPPPIRTLLPVADARVSEATPGGNYGTSTELRVRSAAGGSMHTYLRFDLTGMGTVASAKLRLYCTDESSVGGLVFPTSSGWSETGVNWNNRPAATGAQTASFGAVATNTWVEVDVTSAVTSGGLVSFLMTSSSSNSALYSSREGIQPPELVITTAGP